MTEDSSDLDNTSSEESPDKSNQRRSQQSSRRKRSLRWQIRRQLDKMLRTRRVFRAGFVLLPLAGFIYVSLTNVVLESDDEISRPVVSPVSSAGSIVRAASQAAGDPRTSRQITVTPSSADERPGVTTVSPVQPAEALASDDTRSIDVPANNAQPMDDEPTSDDQPAFSVMQLASKWPIDAIETTELSLSGAVADEETDERKVSDVDAAAPGLEKTTLYEVNEGGSLWRTGRRFINDEVLLDKLIDTLADSGMDVRKVKPGVEFVVHDLGNDGLRVVVDNGDATYESRIVKDLVTTSVQ